MTNKLQEYFDDKEFVVTSSFIEFRDYHINTLYPKNRSEEEFIMDCDSLFFEWCVLESKLAAPPLNWRHDFIIDGQKIDAKKITTINFNIKNQDKLDQYVDSIQRGDLNSFLFYSEKNKYDRPLIVGDTQIFDIISIVDARQVIKNKNESTIEGYFYIPHKQNFTFEDQV